MTKRTIFPGVIAAVAIASVPAAAAPPGTVDVPDVARYQGATIPTTSAADRGLHCAFISDGVECFDSRVQASDAAAGTTRLGTIEPTMMAAYASCAPAMALHDGANFSGSTFYIAVRSV